MGLLAFPSDTHISPYKDLLSQTRWQHLKEQFRYENYRLHQLSDVSVFKVTLQSGLSGLKTQYPLKMLGSYVFNIELAI